MKAWSFKRKFFLIYESGLLDLGFYKVINGKQNNKM